MVFLRLLNGSSQSRFNTSILPDPDLIVLERVFLWFWGFLFHMRVRVSRYEPVSASEISFQLGTRLIKTPLVVVFSPNGKTRVMSPVASFHVRQRQLRVRTTDRDRTDISVSYLQHDTNFNVDASFLRVADKEFI